jgi:hypothetical protein
LKIAGKVTFVSSTAQVTNSGFMARADSTIHVTVNVSCSGKTGSYYVDGFGERTDVPIMTPGIVRRTLEAALSAAITKIAELIRMIDSKKDFQEAA